MHPFHDSTATETNPLEHVYIDIWGPVFTLSAGGLKYFMLIANGATSYKTVYFLSSKSMDATLGAFKDFHCQAEQQTERKLKHVQVDMGREWVNALWN